VEKKLLKHADAADRDADWVALEQDESEVEQEVVIAALPAEVHEAKAEVMVDALKVCAMATAEKMVTRTVAAFILTVGGWVYWRGGG